MSKRDQAIELIRSNIENFGHHVYVVSGGKVPRFAYTIGLSVSVSFELLFCGGTYYSAKEVVEVLNRVARDLRAKETESIGEVDLGILGSFSLRRADQSWGSAMMLGALDFFGKPSIETWQVVPDTEHWTADIPDASQEWDPLKEPVWKSLDGSWDLPVESTATAITNLAALRGARITEAARWEVGQWELFAGAGPDVRRQDVRAVPLSTLVGLDRTLMPVVNLKVGSALWRDPSTGDWQVWVRSK